MAKQEQEQAASSGFQEKYKSMSKEEVITQYNQDLYIFLKTLRRIPHSKLGEKIIDEWGLKEITAHIAAWNLETINGIQMVLRGETPWFFDDTEMVDRYNAEVTERRRNATLRENLREVKINHKKLTGFLEGLHGGIFSQSFGRIWREQNVTPSLVCSYRHYLQHTKDITQWLDPAQKGG